MAIGTLGLFRFAGHSHYAASLGREATLTYAQTIAFTILVAFQWFQAFNARSEHQSVFKVGLFSNRWLLVGVAAAIILQILAVQTDIGNHLFRTTALSFKDWSLIVLVSSSIFVVEEIRKLFVSFNHKAME